MSIRRSILAATLTVIAAGCVGFATQNVGAQRARSSLDDHYVAHYQGQGEGLLALDENNTLWAISEMAGRAEPTYRVMAVTFNNRSRPSVMPEVGRSLPLRGKIIVNIHPEYEAIEISMPETRVSFIAALDYRSMRPKARTPVLDASSFGAATFQAAELDNILKSTSKLNCEVVGDAWPLLLYATGAYAGSLGESINRAGGCCEGAPGNCIAGGPGASDCDLTDGGQSVGVTCEQGTYACCCNVGGVGQILLRASCCEP